MSETFLKEIVFEKNLPVNYRLLSRELNIHTSFAKSQLQEFYNAHSDQLLASYILTGKLKSPAGPSLSITVVPDINSIINSKDEVDEQLKKAKEGFDNIIGCHIYSITSNQLKLKVGEIVSGIESTISEKFPVEKNTEDKLETWGIIKSSEPLKEVSIQQTKLVEVAVPIIVKKDPKSKPQKTFDAGLTTKYVSRKQEKSSKPTVIQALNRGTKRSATEPVKSNKKLTVQKPTSAGYQYTSRKVDPKEKVVISSVKDEDDEEIEDIEAAKARKLKVEKEKQELEKMFDDNDNFGEDESIVEIEEEKKIEPITINSESTLLSVSSKLTQENKVEEPVVDKEEEESERIETYVDEEGFTVTKVIKPANKPKAKAKPISKPKPVQSIKKLQQAKPKAKKKQSNIMNFFGKK